MKKKSKKKLDQFFLKKFNMGKLIGDITIL
jgi:hypothetical protein